MLMASLQIPIKLVRKSLWEFRSLPIIKATLNLNFVLIMISLMIRTNLALMSKSLISHFCQNKNLMFYHIGIFCKWWMEMELNITWIVRRVKITIQLLSFLMAFHVINVLYRYLPIFLPETYILGFFASILVDIYNTQTCLH